MNELQAKNLEGVLEAGFTRKQREQSNVLNFLELLVKIKMNIVI